MSLLPCLNRIRRSPVLVAILLAITSFQVCQANEVNKSEAEAIANEKKLVEEFEYWLLRAYEGDRNGQFNVALLFDEGLGTLQSDEQAFYWYEQAARQGLASAQYNLGHKYMSGIGTRKNPEKALHWWVKAAHQEHELAQFNIASAYYRGIGVELDQEAAQFWFSKAAANGEPRSIKILQSPLFTQAAQPEQTLDKRSATPVYNKPSTTGALLTILPPEQNIEIVERRPKWLKIRSSEGFPVWVYKQFVRITDGQGTLTGSNVNARVAPVIVKGSIVGRLNKGEKLIVLEERSDWVRLRSPARFTAWVEAETLTEPNDKPTAAKAVASTANKKSPQSNWKLLKDKPPASKEKYQFKNNRNDDAWLFSTQAKPYTLQLASFANDKNLERFLDQEQLRNDAQARQFISRRDGIEWKYVLYGSYANLTEAEQAKQKKGFNQAWIRQVKNIRASRCLAWKTSIPTPKSLQTYCQD